MKHAWIREVAPSRSAWMTGVIAVFASAASAQITNSAHDFSARSWSAGEICIPCHTPHFARPPVSVLWNHQLTNSTFLMSGKIYAANDLDITSRLCLSCHDGTVALDSFGVHRGVAFVPDNVNLGTDLSDDHPIGKAALYPPVQPPPGWTSEFRPASLLPQAVALQDWFDPQQNQNTKVVGCTTCHNPHNRGYPHLLNMPNNNSALCLTCHIK